MTVALHARIRRLEQRATMLTFTVFVGGTGDRENAIVISEDDARL